MVKEKVRELINDVHYKILTKKRLEAFENAKLKECFSIVFLCLKFEPLHLLVYEKLKKEVTSMYEKYGKNTKFNNEIFDMSLKLFKKDEWLGEPSCCLFDKEYKDVSLQKEIEKTLQQFNDSLSIDENKFAESIFSEEILELLKSCDRYEQEVVENFAIGIFELLRKNQQKYKREVSDKIIDLIPKILYNEVSTGNEIIERILSSIFYYGMMISGLKMKDEYKVQRMISSFAKHYVNYSINGNKELNYRFIGEAELKRAFENIDDKKIREIALKFLTYEEKLYARYVDNIYSVSSDFMYSLRGKIEYENAVNYVVYLIVQNKYLLEKIIFDVFNNYVHRGFEEDINDNSIESIYENVYRITYHLCEKLSREDDEDKDNV